MREIDLHRMRQAEAEELFHRLLNETRLGSRSEEICLITGRGGVLQTLVLKLARAQELHCYIPMSNPGCVVVEFE